MIIIQGSVEPRLEIDLENILDQPSDLSTAEAIWVRAELEGRQLFMRKVSGPDEGSSSGVVTMEWVAAEGETLGDTDTPGRLWIDVAVDWPGTPTRRQWFRSVDVVDVEGLDVVEPPT